MARGLGEPNLGPVAEALIPPAIPLAGDGAAIAGEAGAGIIQELPRTSRSSRGRIVRRALIAADVVGLTLAYVLAASNGFTPRPHHGYVIGFLLTLPIWIGGMQLYGLYDRDSQRPDHSTVDDIGRIIQLVAVGTWIWVALMWVTTSTSHTSTTLVFFVAAVTLVPISRACARAAVRRHPHYRQNTLIVGAGEVGQLVGRKLVHHPEFGIRVVGFVDAEPKQMRGDLEDYPVLGPPSDIVDLVERYEVDRVIVAFSNDRHDLLVNLVRSLRELDVQIDLVPRLFEAVGPVVYMHGVEGLPLVGLPPSRHPRLACRVKRIGDVVVAGGVLVFTLPLFALIALRIKLDSPGPVFFRQQRLGQDQRTFTLLKFRTMTVDTDDAAHREYLRGIMDTDALPSENNLYKLDRSSQITRAGAWLRHTSLDELPQLINVLRGEMSLVGPRPCIAYETELFEPHHFDRFLVPGGMTGLWQVEARAHATFKEALDLDVAYARNWSLRLDLWLLARTPVALLRGRVTA